jgi:hypothetical protein
MTINNADEFEQLMLDIDNAMRASNTPIVGRELAALGEVAKRLKQPLYGGPEKCEPVPGDYTGRSLTGHIYQWVQQRYGERLLINTTIGDSVTLIRGDPWLLGMPDVIGGPLRFIVDRDLSKRHPSLVINKPGQPKQWIIINVLQCVSDLPPGLAERLTNTEMRAIFNDFIASYACMQLLQTRCRQDDLAIAAHIDLTTSARHIVAHNRELGMSRWASLQAAEKLLKFYLAKQSVAFPKSHKLNTLFELVARNGLSLPPASFVATLQCEASVRYEQQPHTIAECVAAHRAAIGVGVTIMQKLFPGALVMTETVEL